MAGSPLGSRAGWSTSKLGRGPVAQAAERRRHRQHGDGTGDASSGRFESGGGRPWRRQATALPLVNVISLDAATVLLQWATGGMLFCWFTTRRRIASLGYGWLLRGVYFCFAAGSLAAGLSFGVVPVREAASVGVMISCLFALAVSMRRKRAGVSGARVEHDRRSERVAAMTGIERTVEAPTATSTTSRSAPSSRRSSTSCRSLIGTIGLLAAALDAGGNTGGRDRPHAGRRRVHRRAVRRACCSVTGTSPSPACRGCCSTRW